MQFSYELFNALYDGGARARLLVAVTGSVLFRDTEYYGFISTRARLCRAAPRCAAVRRFRE